MPKLRDEESETIHTRRMLLGITEISAGGVKRTGDTQVRGFLRVRPLALNLCLGAVVCC